MGFEIKWKLEDWHVVRYLTNLHVIVSATREEAVRFVHRYMGDEGLGNLYPLKELLDLTEVPEGAICWIQSDFRMEEFGSSVVPGWGTMPKSFWRLPASIILLSNDGVIHDLRDYTGNKWRIRKEWDKSLSDPAEFEKVHWEDGGKVHNWRNHVDITIQQLWDTFNIDQKFAIYRQAEVNANSEEWE